MHEDRERCLRAVRSRDARFDGWLYTGVSSTGIYCRPSCPAMTPKPEHMQFFPSAAAAQQAGLRACKRCRPDACPGSPEWDMRADMVGRAMRLVADGVVDSEGVTGLASRLGYSVRQLERLMVAELGAGPLAVARAARAQTARVLIEGTDLPMGQVAFGAGFSSVRSFNATVGAVFAMTPMELRRRARRFRDEDRRAAPSRGGTEAGATLNLRLPFRQPFSPVGVFGHLAATAVTGVEEWADGSYRRVLRLPRGLAVVALRPATDHVSCRLRLADVRDLPVAVGRCRRLLDLDADPVAVDAVLADDRFLAAAVAAAPGTRVLRSVDGEEMALRAVLGQQVSTAAARTHGARLARAYGTPLAAPDGSLTHAWPSVEVLAGMDPATLSLPRARRAAVTALVAALDAGTLDLGPGGDWDRARAGLAALPGIGPWTVEMVALRALGDPDAFVPTDLGVRTGARALGLPEGPALVAHAAAAWRPWRAYAVAHLWGASGHDITRLPPPGPHPSTHDEEKGSL